MTTTFEDAPLSPKRMPGEPAKPYRGFSIYRDLGPDRSEDKACKQFYAEQGKEHKSARRTGQWSKWAQKYHWVERAALYDELVDEEEREAEAALRQERREKRSRILEECEERMLNVVSEGISLLEKGPTTPVPTVTERKVDKLTGTVVTTKIKPRDLRETSAWFDVLCKFLEQAAQGRYIENRPEEERQVDRVVWVKAPKPDPEEPDSPKSIKGPHLPITPIDPLTADLDEDKAA